MTANLAGLLPRALVLLDVPGRLRGTRAVILRTVTSPLGQATTVEVCLGPCGRAEHDTRTCPAVSVQPDELLLVPADTAEPLYGCCFHMTCPAGCRGHLAPCTKCGQQLKDSPDRQAARAMNAQAPS